MQRQKNADMHASMHGRAHQNFREGGINLLSKTHTDTYITSLPHPRQHHKYNKARGCLGAILKVLLMLEL